MPSSPKVGSNSAGTMAKSFKALLSSGLLSHRAISGEKKNRTSEKANPKMKNSLVSLDIRLLACSSGTRGRKYENALGKPKVKTVSKV